MKKLVLAMMLAAAGVVSSASAQGPGCSNCDQGGGVPSGGYPAGSYGTGGFGSGGYGGGGGGGYREPGHFGNSSAPWMTHPIFGNPRFSRSNQVSRMPTLPVYMAAPWYLYWPYDGHFQTVAPMAAMAPWMPPPQSAFGANPALPTYPGYVPYTPNQNFPAGPRGAAEAAPIPANIPAPAANPTVVPAPPVLPPTKSLPGGGGDSLPKSLPKS